MTRVPGRPRATPPSLAALALLQALLCAACAARGVTPPVPAGSRLRSDCSAAAPCDGVRQEWFSNEAKDAALTDAYCNPPGPGKAGDCRGLEEAVANLHRLNVDYFSDLCRRFAGVASSRMLAFVGTPDRDETSPCGAGQCRVWIWYWSNQGRWASFTVLLGLPTGSTEWLVRRCNYCTTTDCMDMPPTL